MTDKTYQEDFLYRHKNPYHEKLEQFDHFVLRDNECEQFKGRWNSDVFKNEKDIHLEVGSGYGQFMLEYCQKENNINFIGLDYRFKRSFTLVKKINKLNIKDVKYLRARGERIQYIFDENEVSRIFYFFPDPWPKARHKKKRLFNQAFLDQAHKILKKDGQFWIKTDHDDYAEQMEELIGKNTNKFEIKLSTLDLYKEFPENIMCSFQTKFEKIFLDKKTPIKAFLLSKI